MNPLSAIYAVIVQARNRAYDRGSRKSHRLRGPVVSIGNIAVGGSGKTPFLIMLGELLKQRGIAFDVLSRGYGRKTKGIALVNPEGLAETFGDEPLLIARKLEVPVIVGEDRYAAGLFAERKFGPQLHLLDDGFQHRRLARDFDIVLITSTDATDSLLPVGRLREPLSSLARANAVVLTNDTASQNLPIDGQKLWRVRRGLIPLQIDGPCLAFCGIARPEMFFQQLRVAGVQLSGARSFRDHHRYSRSDLDQLLELRKQQKAKSFITTAKDAVNLGLATAALQPIHIAEVRMELEDADNAIDTLLAAIRQRDSQPA